MTQPHLHLHDGLAETSPRPWRPMNRLQSRVSTYDPELSVGTPAGPMAWAAEVGPIDPERVPTRYPLDHPELVLDLEAACGFGAAIERIASRTGLLPAVIVALASRESGFGRRLDPEGPGGTSDLAPRPWPHAERRGELPDDGLGFRRGLLRIDHDRHAFARGPAWRDAEANLGFGADAVGAARRILRQRTSLTPRAQVRAAIAAWNAGLGSVMRALRQGLDVDAFTSGRAYAQDVLDRADFFQAHGFD